VDGVEKAAATLPPAANAGGVGEPFAGGDGGSGIAVRIGGVSGAPNDADRVTAGFDSALGGGPCSRGTDGTLRGENGGVRGRGGGAGGSARFGVGGAVLGGGACTRGGAWTRGGASGRGTGGGHDAAAPEGAGVPALASTGFTPTGVLPMAGAADVAVAETWRSSPQLTAAPTGMSPPHTEQRARMATLVIFAGSSLKTDRHSGQETFIGISGLVASAVPPAAALASMSPNAGQPNTRTRRATSRMPSFRSPAHSPEPAT